MKYKLIYSDRKTISASVKGGILTVRAPRGLSTETIEKFLKKHSSWIEKHLNKEKVNEDFFHSLNEDDIRQLKTKAKEYFANKLLYYSNIMGIKHGRMTITSAKARFGSCSSKGNISFSWRLMLYPEPAREYVAVHELAHVLEMNHSQKFYKIIENVLPDYKERKKLLSTTKLN